jgi:glutathione S-transferase
MAKPTLYQFVFSCSAEKARRALHHKGVSFDAVEIDWFDRSKLKEASGQTRVPIFKSNGDTVGPTSMAIVDYVERHFPGPTLYPGDSRGLAHLINEYVETILFPLGMCAFLPAAASVLKSEAFDKDVVRMVGKTPEQLWAELPQIKDKYAPHLAHLDDHLSTRKFLAGDNLSAADHILYSNLWLATNNPKFAEMASSLPIPHLQAWMGRMKEDYFTKLPF